MDDKSSRRRVSRGLLRREFLVYPQIPVATRTQYSTGSKERWGRISGRSDWRAPLGSGSSVSRRGDAVQTLRRYPGWRRKKKQRMGSKDGPGGRIRLLPRLTAARRPQIFNIQSPQKQRSLGLSASLESFPARRPKDAAHEITAAQERGYFGALPAIGSLLGAGRGSMCVAWASERRFAEDWTPLKPRGHVVASLTSSRVIPGLSASRRVASPLPASHGARRSRRAQPV